MRHIHLLKFLNIEGIHAMYFDVAAVLTELPSTFRWGAAEYHKSMPIFCEYLRNRCLAITFKKVNVMCLWRYIPRIKNNPWYLHLLFLFLILFLVVSKHIGERVLCHGLFVYLP